jgi:peptidoglycan/xylan/chitin deacetylase (PgdA/CDA1 family)
MDPTIVFLMYHELELPGRSLCRPEAGYIRYVLRISDFQSQVRSLQQAGWKGWSVGEALTFPSTPGVAITFDDGCETDLLSAAPILKEVGFEATFYVTVGFLDRPGYMSPIQVRELASLGFEIGCHSMTHPYLSDLQRDRLHEEIAVPKLKLENITGRPVKHFSCPGGRWNRTVAEVARDAGYESITTSSNRGNSPGTDFFSLGRVAILRDMNLDTFQRICRAQSLWRLQLKEMARSSGKKLMGNSGYDAIRALLLREKRS